MKRCHKSIFGAWLSLAMLATFGASIAAEPAIAEQETVRPLERHMQKILTGAGQWRAPNPDYKTGENAPRDYGLRFRLSPDKTHVTGELTGIYNDGREVTYFSLIAMYNPVTEKVITQQIGWNGLYLYGENPVQPGDDQIIDMFEYAPNGAVKIGRHKVHFVNPDVHESDAYERDEDGEWALKAKWTWRRHDAE